MSITASSLKNYQVQINAGNHAFVSDEPVGIGDDAGPSPFDLLLSSLASCTIITMHMYAKRKNWPLERVEMRLSLAGAEPPVGSQDKTTIIISDLVMHGDLTPEQVQRLEEIAHRCPVHKVLRGEIQIQIAFDHINDIVDFH